MHLQTATSVAVAIAFAACEAPPQLLPLVATGGASVGSIAPLSTSLEVVSRAAAAPDPLRVRGSSIAYGNLEEALGMAVSAAASRWAGARRDHPVAKSGGWTLLVEVTRADAELESGGRLIATIEVRATLRTRSGNAYLGQTELGCREGGLVSAEAGVPVMYRCITAIGRDAAGWLAGGVELNPPSSVRE